MIHHSRFIYPFFRGLSVGVFRPLYIWGGVCIVIVCGLWFLPDFWDINLTATQFVGAFLDPGVFGGIDFADKGVGTEGELVLLIISFLSVLFVSAMLVSMITNTFRNITYKFHNGDFRYALKNYILIIGSGDGLSGILAQATKQNLPIVIFAPNHPNIDGYKYYFYRGDKTCAEDLQTIEIEKASVIYVLSDKSISNDDANCLACIDILRKLTKSCNDKIHCYVITNEFTTSEIFSYSQKDVSESSNLFLVDIINTNEYVAEQLLLKSNFLPIIHAKDDTSVNIVILGAGNLARGIAYTIAHICHYPKQNGQLRKTRITIMDAQVKQLQNSFISSRAGLFELSSYTIIDATGQRIEHHPAKDFLDIEWEFIACSSESEFGQQFLKENAQRTKTLVQYIICPDNETMTMQYALHLPRVCYNNPIAVHVNDAGAMVHRANQTFMYGHLIPFGFSNECFDSDLLSYRSEAGQRVNYIYDQAYSTPPSKNKEDAWYKLSESHKLSSIYCALAMPLRERCFDNDFMARAESEHRRWMMSVLLIGNYAAAKTDKTHFLHQDIMPFDDLPEGEKDKDKLLLDATNYILNG